MSGLVDCGRDVGFLGGTTATKAVAAAGSGVGFGWGRMTKLSAFALAVSHFEKCSKLTFVGPGCATCSPMVGGGRVGACPQAQS